jgi:pyruvate carboxylase subunit B
MGADSLCIKDMAGMISPYDAYEMIKALKETIKIPIQLHTHYTSGQGSMTYLKAVEAGVDVIDTALAPFALRSSQPAIEPILVALEGTPRATGLDLVKIFEAGLYIETIAPKYRQFLDTTRMAIIDTGVLLHQIPGGMTTNLVSQLREANALHRIQEVYDELPKTRKELGYPPLVTPTSQIVGVQAVLNVLMGRYKMIAGEVKDYCYGLYGASPAPIDPEVQKLALKGYPRGETPITHRAADVLEPEMEKAREATKDIAKNIGDVLVYALYPQTGMRFLRWKYGLEPIPPEAKPKTLEDVKREDDLIKKALAGKLMEKPTKTVPEKGPAVRKYNVFVDGDYYAVEVEGEGEEGVPVIRQVTPVAKPAAAPKPAPAPAAAPAEKKAAAAAPAATGAGAVKSPMPGMIVEVKCAVGDKVKQGDEVVILEAMKMQNPLPAPIAGVVKSIHVKKGDSVSVGDVLIVIE